MPAASKTFDPTVLGSFPATFDSLKERNLLTPALTIERLKELLNAEQRDIVNQILNLDPKDYGVSSPYVGDLEAVLTDLVVAT
jgi:hypothetical protein